MDLNLIYSRAFTEAWQEHQKDGMEKIVQCPPKFRTSEGSVNFKTLTSHFGIPREKLEDDGTSRVRIIGTVIPEKKTSDWSNWS